MSLDGPELPEPRKAASGHRVFDLLISFCALFMSGVSIFMAYHTSHSMEKLVHANSWPFVRLDSGNYNETRAQPNIMEFLVKNVGSGPARIHSFEFIFDGAPMSGGFYWDKIAEACCTAERQIMQTRANGDLLIGYGLIGTTNVDSNILAPSEEIRALGWQRGELNHELWDAMDTARQNGRLTMRACFCSVFDECWIAEANTFPPRPVASCAPDASASAAPH